MWLTIVKKYSFENLKFMIMLMCSNTENNIEDNYNWNFGN